MTPTVPHRSPRRHSPPLPAARRRPHAASRAAALLALALAAVAPGAFASGTAPPLDLGEPSVLSQRGQRLKLALPYGSAPGERVSATRFEVVSVSAADGWRAPDPAGFEFAKPPRRNFVYLTSREPVDAPELTVVLRVADQPEGEQTWRIAVPPARAAVSAVPVSAPAAAVPRAARGSAAARAARRTPAGEARSPRQ
jgi:hypothetical protein